MTSLKRAPQTGLVLSGGGARGAYEAGVIRYILDELPVRIRPHVRLEILCGASIGALNCCFLASTSHMPEMQGQGLSDLWLSLQIEKVYKFGLREIMNLPRFILGSRGRGQLDDILGPGRLGGLFNTSPMEELVHKQISWPRIHQNLKEGFFKALAINATHVSTGKTHVFVELDGHLPYFSTDPQVEAHRVEIGPNHTLASAAIPWIFPAVAINSEIYTDGSLKLNTPISPALRLGADRLLVVGLRTEDLALWRGENTYQEQKIDAYPSISYMLGKILNALLMDKTEYDLKRLRRYNALLKEGEAMFGGDFIKLMDDLFLKARGAPYREIQTLEVRPSMDIAEIASRHLQRGSIASRAGSLVGPLLRRLGDIGVGQGSDLLSYLLFDHEFALELINLGMHDADSRRQEIIEFFSV